MADKRRVPEIRFKGFSGEWAESEFSGLVSRITLMCDQIDLPRIEYEDIISGSGTLNKDVFKKKSIKRGIKFDKGDILFGKLRPYLNNLLLTHFKGIAVGDFWVLRANITDVAFIYSFLQNGKFQYVANLSTGSKMPRSDWSIVSLSKFLIPPSIKEQSQIGTFLKNIDSLITLHQRKYDKLTTVKKAMLEKMFPKDGVDVPKIRFEGFTEKWERLELRKITTPFAEPVPTPKDGYWRLGIRSHAKGTFHSVVQPGRELETAKMHRVIANNLIVSITFAWEHAVAITDASDDGKLVSHRFPQFSFNEGMVPEYFKFLILDNRFKYHLWLSSPGGAGRNRVLKVSEMLEYPFWVPKEAEQSKIADFLQNIDTLITLQQREIEKLKNIKKACLEKMFV